MLEKKKKKTLKMPTERCIRCGTNIKVIDGAPASATLHTPQGDKVHGQFVPQEVMRLYLK